MTPRTIGSAAEVGLTPDPNNANAGTARGAALLEESLRRYGGVRGIGADKFGRIIAGNHVLEQAEALGLKFKIVESDGKTIIVTKRTDLDLDTKEGREAALADNRIGYLGYNLTVEGLEFAAAAGADLSLFWHEDEIPRLLPSMDGTDTGEGDGGTLGEHGSSTHMHMLTYGKHRLPMSDEDGQALELAIKEWADAHGTMLGFAHKLLHALGGDEAPEDA